jgi:hypothetical protein
MAVMPNNRKENWITCHRIGFGGAYDALGGAQNRRREAIIGARLKQDFRWPDRDRVAGRSSGQRRWPAP